jgi:putative Mn2+ efflux pump MntP
MASSHYEYTDSHHWQALVLAFASSTDNFLVGLCTGLVGKPLPVSVLWGISICNAAGSLVATAGGAFCANTLHATAQLQYGLAAAAFGYLAWMEYRESPASTTTSSYNPTGPSSSSRQQASLSLALPMTLNNLAGGVAGGVVGLSAVTASLYALFISVITMWVGYRLGRFLHGRQSQQGTTLLKSSHRSVYFSILLYSLLSLQSLWEAVVGS